MKSYIAFGSNVGDRHGHIEGARKLLVGKEISLLRMSPLYETKALCRPGQNEAQIPNFLNGVFEVETTLPAEQLLNVLKTIEIQMGRTSKGDWAPRIIDLDILFYGDQVMETVSLQIPHPEIQNRWFVLKPLSDLIPDFVHPILHVSMRDLLSDFIVAYGES